MTATVPTPQLTAEQRAEALTKATAVRMARRAFKDAVVAGDHSLRSAIETAKRDEGLAGIRVVDLLQCLPRIGPKGAVSLMSRTGVAMSRRIRGLGPHQVAALLAAVGE